MSVTAGVTFFTSQRAHEADSERHALLAVNPKGFTIRHPPKPHELTTTITPDGQLFQTIHMGAAVVCPDTWQLVVEGLVSHPFSITLSQLKALPATTITAFHECYGSPLKPPTTPLWRVGNIRWTGVRLNTLLSIAKPHESARFVWSEGLEHGEFAGIEADRYQKDLPMEKAMRPEVMLAYAMNGEPLTKERGFPVRLVVPGWFGTNSTKWVCRLVVKEQRAPGPYTTTLYNEVDPRDQSGKKLRPVWTAEVNSMICGPAPGEAVVGNDVLIWGRAWGSVEIETVEVGIDGGTLWLDTHLDGRKEFEWQRFERKLVLLGKGRHHVMARARDREGAVQPLTGRRNCVHSIEFDVV